jgi:hypothetical protein
MRRILDCGVIALVWTLSMAGRAGGEPRYAADSPADRMAAVTSMADAERACARAAKTRGVRAAFLEFLDDDAIALHPTLGNAKDVWRSRPEPANPLGTSLTWEPRTGDVSDAGDFGWLTGPYTLVAEDDAAHPRYGCYFSIWQRSADRPWRVLIDVGISTPDPCVFTVSGFVPLPESAGHREQLSGTSKDALLREDRLRATGVREHGVGRALLPILDERVRFHRNGRQPILGFVAVRAYLETAPTGWSFTPVDGGIARSEDLGYTYGQYDGSPRMVPRREAITCVCGTADRPARGQLSSRRWRQARRPELSRVVIYRTLLSRLRSGRNTTSDGEARRSALREVGSGATRPA